MYVDSDIIGETPSRSRSSSEEILQQDIRKEEETLEQLSSILGVSASPEPKGKEAARAADGAAPVASDFNEPLLSIENSFSFKMPTPQPGVSGGHGPGSAQRYSAVSQAGSVPAPSPTLGRETASTANSQFSPAVQGAATQARPKVQFEYRVSKSLTSRNRHRVFLRGKLQDKTLKQLTDELRLPRDTALQFLARHKREDLNISEVALPGDEDSFENVKDELRTAVRKFVRGVARRPGRGATSLIIQIYIQPYVEGLESEAEEPDEDDDVDFDM